jgi:autophagy-related protein 2
MISFKVLLTHPEAQLTVLSVPQSLEASVILSILPIRLNIDQDTFFFIYDFCCQLMTSNDVIHQKVSGVEHVTSNDVISPHQALHTNNSHESLERPSNDIFIKSFVFSPDLPIRIDYEAKRLLSEQLGTLAGLLLGLSHLDNSEVTLKSLTYKQGILGWDQLVEEVVGEWSQDIKTYQLPRILQGVGPMYHVTQLFQGVVDLFWFPLQQYQEDGRIVWGLQRGTNSFVSSSGIAVVELTNRILHSVQSLAETAFDIVSPGEMKGTSVNNGPQNSQLVNPHQPADVREGIANAYNVVTTGLTGAARDLYEVAYTEHSDHGVTGAMGGVLRQIPGNLFRPIIFASEATRHVLGGVKNQFVPEARKEANEKWKTDQN